MSSGPKGFRAETEGGRLARPLGARARLAIVMLVMALLALAVFATNHAGMGGAPALLDVGEEVLGEALSDGGELRSIDWSSLPDSVVAWVEVPGTNIDEPIAQAEGSSPNRYLYEDALGQGAYGTPYLDWECSPDSPFAIVYGHNMSDGSAFADFARFSDRAFADVHRDIRVYVRSGGGIFDLEVVAVDVVDANSETVRVSFEGEDDRSEYLESRISGSDLIFGEAGDYQEARVWAFATCSYQTANSRTVVYAIEKG